jgi:D-alanyl-D-alanine carboxypeptidase
MDGGLRAGLALLVPLLLAAVLFLRPGAAEAQIGSERYSSIIIDAGTGRVLEAVSPDETRFPASLTKMMTIYVLFEALRDQRVKLDQPVPISEHSASMFPSKLGLVPSSRITVEEALLGLVTKSANDAAAALGELLGGSEDRFAQMMTLRARALGMNATTFRNASGLPDPEQVTSARDMAVLARHLIQDFPAEYRYFSAPQFVFHGRVIRNHDHMLTMYPGADGIKTGYTEAAGHNLVTSAVHEGVRLIGVIMGAKSNFERDVQMASLLDQGFETMNVPMVPRREAPVMASIPRFVGSAHAATVSMPPPANVRVAERARPQPAGRAARWGVQVGSFPSVAAAQQAVSLIRREAAGGEVRVQPAALRHRPAWRAQLVGLSQADAQSACGSLAKRGMPCVVLRALPGRVASR